ncbi:M56 family metallopeptidase [Nocardiopsis dassonvillei]|uniref:M56 family metallopeptidase n=1 Tax=Nocardiopsis dassonvillei TaxID=2014 RepID=UPI00036A839C|nr:M56 family metallopeptidase [Nocardiopsis dassonvillei]MCK9872340.1 M56 family metallopeptidase [Nocardiopsis dassonvillei]
MVTLVLAAYSAVGIAVAAPLLARAAWVERAPRLALVLWQALAASVVMAAALAGLAVVVPVLPLSADLAGLLQMCLMMLRGTYSTFGEGLASTAGLAVAFGIVGRCAYGVSAEWVRVLRERRHHLRILAMVGTGNEHLGATVLDHGAAAAYCLPGRGGRVVLTSAALAALDEAGLEAVLAHERAHLSGRHHLLVALTRGVERAFPFVRAFALARSETARLVELAADDAATLATDRLTVAGALLALAKGGSSEQSPMPEAVLAASGHGTGNRVRRLIDGRTRLSPWQVVLGGAVAVAVVIAPLAVVVIPAIAMAGAHCCPTP